VSAAAVSSAPAGSDPRALLPDGLGARVEQETGARITAVRPRGGGGASREGAELTLAWPDGRVLECYMNYDVNKVGAGDDAAFLREETVKHGFATADGVHMGPCELHKKHAYTVGPEGSLYACPGFAGEASLSVGHIDGRGEATRQAAAAEFDDLAAWKKCGDCAFIPVCGGGCAVAAHTELGDKHLPSCHKPSFEAGLVSLAHQAIA